MDELKSRLLNGGVHSEVETVYGVMMGGGCDVYSSVREVRPPC